MSDKTKLLIAAWSVLVLDAVSEVPSEEKEQAIALLKEKINAYQPGEAVAIPTLLADLKIAIEASEDAAEKANLIPGTDKVFDVLEAIVAGTKPFWALIGGLFH
jgi:hypothetical protein